MVAVQARCKHETSATSRVMRVATCATNGYDCRSNAITLQSRETVLIAGDRRYDTGPTPTGFRDS